VERAVSVPGVQSAAVASNFPLNGGLARTIFLEGEDEKSGQRGSLTTLTMSPQDIFKPREFSCYEAGHSRILTAKKLNMWPS
jgi:hypothetical protein